MTGATTTTTITPTTTTTAAAAADPATMLPSDKVLAGTNANSPVGGMSTCPSMDKSPNSLGHSFVRAECGTCKIVSENAVYDEPSETLRAHVDYTSTVVEGHDNVRVRNITKKVSILTSTRIPRVGVMIVGLGGNNGTTLLAGILANKHKITWQTKEGVQKPNWYGSLAMAGSTRLGLDEATGELVYVPIRSLVPLLDPEHLVFTGWDISGMPMGAAMRRAQVIEYDLQRQVYDQMQSIKPLPGIYDPTFIAKNQDTRADNCIQGTKYEQYTTIRSNIAKFKAEQALDKVIVLWSANTERMSVHTSGVHDTAAELMEALKSNNTEIAPSLIFAMAAVDEGCSYINGSPQNTFCSGIVEMARDKNVFLVGDDLKTGQTKLKSVLVDFLVSAGLKPTAVCSYNHLGNNDGLNLSAPEQFRSKEVSKSGVVDDMVSQNSALFALNEKPDHIVVIKYVPQVGDSKRALDEYTSRIFLNGQNTIVVHNTCEDSLLAAPVILDLIIFCEFFQRVDLTIDGAPDKMEPLLSFLSYWCKAPAVPSKGSVVNALFVQREALTNFCRACQGLAPNSYIDLEYRMQDCCTSSLFK